MKSLKIIFMILIRVTAVFGLIALVVFLLWGILYLLLY